MSSSKFPLIELTGDAKSRGFQHGTLLKDRIKQSIVFYKGVFGQTEEEILSQASHFRQVIIAFNPEYGSEIEAIAEGADVDSLWIYALNARSEILTMFISECTAMYSSDERVLAQTWDWAEELENLAVVIRVITDDNEILMMTEPGIIGKIGMNHHGIGVTLNFLHRDGKLPGVPIHILLRAILDQTNMDDVAEIIERAQGGQAGNIIVASGDGTYTNYEFAGDKYYKINNSRNMFHTNHYLSDERLNTRKDKIESSLARYKRASELISDDVLTKTRIQQILTDQKDELPICRPYREDPDLGYTGTICAIMMDLEQLEFRLSPGNPKNNAFMSYTFG